MRSGVLILGRNALSATVMDAAFPGDFGHLDWTWKGKLLEAYREAPSTYWKKTC